MLAKSKLDRIETFVSQALIDMEISHEEFNATIKEKEKYKRKKENVRMSVSATLLKQQENMSLNSMNPRKITSF